MPAFLRKIIYRLKHNKRLYRLISPINGMYGNMNSDDTATLADALKPGLTIPCHYGMFAAHGGNPYDFINIIFKDFPDRKYLIMTPGEGLVL